MGNTSTDLKVTEYWLNYRVDSGLVRIWVKTDQGDEWMLVDEITPEKAAFIKDMLEAKVDVLYTKGESLHITKELT